MERKVYRQEQIEEVVSLRQKGKSWLNIQEQSGVPRRAAKKLFADWEESKSLEDLKAARREVVAGELRKHLDEILDFAGFLVGSLDVPKSPDESRSAEAVFSQLLTTQVLAPTEQRRSSGQVAMPRLQERVLRQNRLLIGSLQRHTGKKVNWKIFEQWKKEWDACVAIQALLKKKAFQLAPMYLDRPSGLAERVVKGTDKKDAIELISDAVVQAVWWAATSGSLEEKNALFVVPSNGKNKVMLNQNGMTIPILFPETITEDVARACTRATRHLFQEDITNQVRLTFKNVRGKVAYFEEMLDPLVLRSLILKYRCDLCPV